MSTLGARLQPPTPARFKQKAERALTKAEAQGNPEHKIGDALVGIGWAVLHWAEQGGRADGNQQ